MSSLRGSPRRDRAREISPQDERIAIVLDVVRGGYYLDPHKGHRSRTIAQALGISRFTLIDGVPVGGDVEPFERVTVALEMLTPVEEPLDPTGRRTRRIDVVLACLPKGDTWDQKVCAPASPVEKRLLDLMRIAMPEDVELMDDLGSLKNMIREKGLPAKILACPKTIIHYDSLTEIARRNLMDAVRQIVKEREADFVRFFNMAGPINIRMHSLELLHGIGKKMLKQVLDARAKKLFTSFDDIKKVIKEDPTEVLAGKIVEELAGQAKYYLFIEPPRPDLPFLDYLTYVARAGAPAGEGPSVQGQGESS